MEAYAGVWRAASPLGGAPQAMAGASQKRKSYTQCAVAHRGNEPHGSIKLKKNKKKRQRRREQEDQQMQQQQPRPADSPALDNSASSSSGSRCSSAAAGAATAAAIAAAHATAPGAAAQFTVPTITTTTVSGSGGPRLPPATRMELAGLEAGPLARAVRLLGTHGMVVLGPATLPADFLRSLKLAADGVADEVQQALHRRGIPYQVGDGEGDGGGDGQAHTQSARTFERRHSFRFAEVASRCLGRLDIRHGLDHPPFSDPLLSHNPVWWPVITAVLGREARLEYAGIVLSLPGSAMQSWHVDGGHLWGRQLQCPPHCVDIFVPLMDMSPQLGPTEFVPGSHMLTAAASLDALLVAGAGHADQSPCQENFARCAPVLRAGSVVMYDHRLVHRGTPNTSDRPRPMLYLMYSKKWFQETQNFDPHSKLFEQGSSAAGVDDIGMGAAPSATVLRDSRRSQASLRAGMDAATVGSSLSAALFGSSTTSSAGNTSALAHLFE
jgi:hypothetical protein